MKTSNRSSKSKGVKIAEEEFIQFVKFHGVNQLAHSLRMIHDLALYDTDTAFDAAEKTALFDLKVLWEGVEKMGK